MMINADDAVDIMMEHFKDASINERSIEAMEVATFQAKRKAGEKAPEQTAPRKPTIALLPQTKACNHLLSMIMQHDTSERY